MISFGCAEVTCLNDSRKKDHRSSWKTNENNLPNSSNLKKHAMNPNVVRKSQSVCSTYVIVYLQLHPNSWHRYIFQLDTICKELLSFLLDIDDRWLVEWNLWILFGCVLHSLHSRFKVIGFWKQLYHQYYAASFPSKHDWRSLHNVYNFELVSRWQHMSQLAASARTWKWGMALLPIQTDMYTQL